MTTPPEINTAVRHDKVATPDIGLRLDRWFLKYFPALTHGRLEKLLRQGRVRLDGKRVKSAARLAAGQTIRIPPEALGSDANKTNATAKTKSDPSLAARLIPQILHKDAHILVLNKPAGLAVQGGSKTHIHIDAALPHLQMEAAEPPRLVHRLDRDTSGLLVLARTRQAAQFLTRNFASREVEKIYWALVYDAPRPLTGSITAALAKRTHGQGGEVMQIVDAEATDALPAHTDYTTIKRIRRLAWLAFRPHTGRTHQIRAHSQSLGHAIVGDTKYRAKNPPKSSILEKGLHLHARSIMMPHPRGGRFVCHAPLQAHMAHTWQLLGFDAEYAENPFEPKKPQEREA